MTRALLVRALVLLLLAALGVALYLRLRGRNSRVYHWLSAAASPLMRGPAPPEAVLPRPYLHEFNAPPGSGWRWHRGDMVEAAAADGALSLVPTRESVWWLNDRGPMLYHHLAGDATVVTRVRTRKRSDPSVPPDMEWQFAGIILRDPRSDRLLSREDYVFNVVGHRGRRLQVETKSTRKGRSRVDAWDWESGDAELRIDRRGAEFRLYARADAAGPWTHLITYERPDLPPVLQLGMVVYAYSEGRGRYDLQAFFDILSVR